MDPQRLTHNVADGHPGIERTEWVLEDETHVSAESPQARPVGGKNVGAVKDDSAGSRGHEAYYRPGDGGFSAAALADQAQGPAGANGQADAVHGFDVADSSAQQTLLDGKVGLQFVNFE